MRGSEVRILSAAPSKIKGLVVAPAQPKSLKFPTGRTAGEQTAACPKKRTSGHGCGSAGRSIGKGWSISLDDAEVGADTR